MGEPDYIQSSVVSGASILCYMNNVPGLGYDAGHNYQRWTLASYPSIFPDSGKKYIYVAIPRVRTGDNDIATVVFPSQRIDIYGKAIIEQTKEDGSKELVSGDQIGNENFYYIYLQGIISEVKTDTDNTRKREWEQHIDCGSWLRTRRLPAVEKVHGGSLILQPIPSPSSRLSRRLHSRN